MRIFFRVFFLIISLFFSPFYFLEFKKLVEAYNIRDHIQLFFLISFIASTIIFLLFLKAGSFFAIFEHELTHIIWGLLFFKAPTGLEVREDIGGVVEIYGGNFLISLAPYFFQTINFLLLPFYFCIKQSCLLGYFIVFGIALGYHTSSTLKEFHFNQPDLYVGGLVFSLIFLVFANLITYGVLLAFVIGRWELSLLYLKNGVMNTIIFIKNFLF